MQSGNSHKGREPREECWSHSAPADTRHRRLSIRDWKPEGHSGLKCIFLSTNRVRLSESLSPQESAEPAAALFICKMCKN